MEVIVSWLLHEVIVTMLKAPFVLDSSAGGEGVDVCLFRPPGLMLLLLKLHKYKSTQIKVVPE